MARQKTIDIVIETPKGARNKYVYDEKFKAFRLKKILPAGAVFPFDFGFIPGTMGEDGDPIDVLVIMDEPAYPGCIIESRVIGALKARQTEKGKTLQNDRLIAVCIDSDLYKNVRDIKDLNKTVRSQIEQFFISYNSQAGKVFHPQGWTGAAGATRLVEAGKEKK
jgi:inorganic pyrophosphatase